MRNPDIEVILSNLSTFCLYTKFATSPTLVFSEDHMLHSVHFVEMVGTVTIVAPC